MCFLPEKCFHMTKEAKLISNGVETKAQRGHVPAIFAGIWEPEVQFVF